MVLSRNTQRESRGNWEFSGPLGRRKCEFKIEILLFRSYLFHSALVTGEIWCAKCSFSCVFGALVAAELLFLRVCALCAVEATLAAWRRREPSAPSMAWMSIPWAVQAMKSRMLREPTSGGMALR